MLPIVMDLETIKKVLPHRYPFLLIDRVVEIINGPKVDQRVGRRVRAIKNVTCNEPFFQGHFPGRPVMPGVLVIESMAQACALAAVLPTDPLMNVAIISIDRARFRKPIIPGDTLELRSFVEKDRGQILSFYCESFVENIKVAEAKVLAKVWPMEINKL